MVECYLDTVEVSGSTPLVPTRKIKGLGKTIQGPFALTESPFNFGTFLAVFRFGDNRFVLSWRIIMTP